MTQSEDGKRLYIHLQTYPMEKLYMDGMDGKVAYAQFLHDASEIVVKDNISSGGGGVNRITIEKTVFSLPVVQPNVISPVIEVFLK